MQAQICRLHTGSLVHLPAVTLHCVWRLFVSLEMPNMFRSRFFEIAFAVVCLGDVRRLQVPCEEVSQIVPRFEATSVVLAQVNRIHQALGSLRFQSLAPTSGNLLPEACS